ncbi:sodium-dependent transporter [Helicobacter monodelphidis]|uniref:sodium-dependent transporter n=1 Tax=Helicobacter sp. 15-1451 TaxID=2004995 RepID=UPI000DCCEA95|nr:sodium-dependent transporter [Helicobacter sp. 15-1451]RAX57578.1 sodium-dependent transporter [Helicobacter sp. 15-1451]
MVHFSKIGFILSLAGSAIGLGNIWKFPYVAGQNGGGIFVIIFILSVIFVLCSVFLAEMILGRESSKNPVSTFEMLAPRHKNLWKYSGYMFISGLLILAFYSMILGWITYYMFYLLFYIPENGATAQALFDNFGRYELFWQIVCHLAIIAICGFILVRGIKKGIEQINLILMPALFIIFIMLFFYVITLDSFPKAVDFMFDFKWEQVNSGSILEALGQAFFSMSLGVGTIMAYSAAMPRHINFVSSSFYIATLNTILALIAGLVVFSLLFKEGLSPDAGPNLIFVSLPIVFYQMGWVGHIVAFIFFLALLFAGVTSAISMAEPAIAYLIERHHLKRPKATFLVITFCFLVGGITILGQTDYFHSAEYLGGFTVFQWIDLLTSTVFMPLSGVIICLFVGFVISQNELYGMFSGTIPYWFFRVWLILIRYIAPIVIVVIMLQNFLNKFFEINLIQIIFSWL